MFSSSNGLSAADVAAVMNGNSCNNGGFGYGFGEGWWVIIILFALFGGFGRGFGGMGSYGGCNTGCGCQSAIATVADVQRGFDNQGVTNKLNGLENGLADGFYSMNSALMSGFNGVNTAIQNSAMNAMQNTNAIQQAIQADTVANMQNTNALATQLLLSLQIAAVRIGLVSSRSVMIWLLRAMRSRWLFPIRRRHSCRIRTTTIVLCMMRLSQIAWRICVLRMPICVARFRLSISLRVRQIRTPILSIPCVPARSPRMWSRTPSAAISRLLSSLCALLLVASNQNGHTRKGVTRCLS